MAKIFPYRYDQLSGRIGYEERQAAEEECDAVDKKIHLGQLKLLITEIMFLSKVSSPGDTVVYVGAGSGYHNRKLAKMFPKLKFELWDKTKFDVDETDNIKLFTRYFFDEDAIDYKKSGKSILFMCDMRVLNIRDAKSLKDDGEIIEQDMIDQMRWVQIMRPKYTFLKFRFSWEPGKVKYLTGTVYLQPYSPVSTEARLLTKNYDDVQTYDRVEYDEKMSYFACKYRFGVLYDNRWDDIMKKHKIRTIWDNYIAFYTLFHYLTKKHDEEPTDEQVAVLFNDIVKFLRDRYGKKYDIIYEKVR